MKTNQHREKKSRHCGTQCSRLYGRTESTEVVTSVYSVVFDLIKPYKCLFFYLYFFFEHLVKNLYSSMQSKVKF